MLGFQLKLIQGHRGSPHYNAMANPFESLPRELLDQICVELTPMEMGRLALVCRYFAEVSRDWNFWAEKAYHDYAFPRPLFLTARSMPDLSGYHRYRYVEAYQSAYWVPLTQAVAYPEIDIVKYILSRHKNLNLDSVLYTAAAHNQIELVDFLIQRGATDLNYALDKASWSGHLDMVKFLLRHRVTPNGHNLYEAVRAAVNQINIVKCLIQHGVTDYTWGVIGACQHGNLEIVKLLIESGQPATNFYDYRYTIERGHSEAMMYGFSAISDYLGSIRRQLAITS
jgi:hypothetical protein